MKICFKNGCVGLIKAVDNFDESKGFAFSTYAVPVIMVKSNGFSVTAVQSRSVVHLKKRRLKHSLSEINLLIQSS